MAGLEFFRQGPLGQPGVLPQLPEQGGQVPVSQMQLLKLTETQDDTSRYEAAIIDVVNRISSTHIRDDIHLLFVADIIYVAFFDKPWRRRRNNCRVIADVREFSGKEYQWIMSVFLPNIRDIPDEHLTAIFAHEIGHIYLTHTALSKAECKGRNLEREADNMAKRWGFDIQAYYEWNYGVLEEMEKKRAAIKGDIERFCEGEDIKGLLAAQGRFARRGCSGELI